MGVEGAQGGIGYTYLSFLDPGDEIIVTDPGYFHFVPAAGICGATIVPITLDAGNEFRLTPEAVAKAITPRTKMIVVCDPINPFGTIQTRGELLEIARIARDKGIIIFNNITHNTHQTDPKAQHLPMASLHGPGNDMSHVISVSGMTKGYGMAATAGSASWPGTRTWCGAPSSPAWSSPRSTSTTWASTPPSLRSRTMTTWTSAPRWSGATTPTSRRAWPGARA